jgi:hypothetical protein
VVRSQSRQQNADLPHALALLRPCRKQPTPRAQPRKDIAPFALISSDVFAASLSLSLLNWNRAQPDIYCDAFGYVCTWPSFTVSSICGHES